MPGDESDFDARIDTALRRYAEPEETPAPRLAAARILERVREVEDRRRRLRSWAIPLTACLAAIAVVSLIWMARVPRVAEIARPPAAPAALATAEVRTPPATGRSRELRRSSAVRLSKKHPSEAQLPRLDTFPSPEPLTDAEQALAEFAATAPPPARKQLVEVGKRWNEPISIAELKIRPLDLGENHESEGKTERQ